MFKKFTISLSKPPLTIFFMKDSWFKVIFYVLFVTFLVVIPAALRTAIDPTMDVDTYKTMQKMIKSDFIIENARITNGTLTYEAAGSSSFEYFSFYLGKQEYSNRNVNFIFEENDLVIYAANVELERASYESLNLHNYDFSSTNLEDVTKLSIAFKTMYENQPSLLVAEVIAVYFIAVLDYVGIALVMTVLMVFFINKIPIPFSHRFKLSLYLTTVYAVVQLILILFNIAYLNILAMLAVYIYHVWTYRSIKIIPKGVI